MNAWNPDELDRIGRADELQIASRRHDGSLPPYVTIWVVRVGDDLYVRSAYGPDSGWYRHARASGEGRIRASGVERDVTFELAEPQVAGTLTAAYHTKYDSHGAAVVDPVVSPEAEQLTLRLVPRLWKSACRPDPVRR
jgi:hypothetical protein